MNRLAVVIIHYHLRPGGVTRVIERSIESLHDRVDLLILTGEAPAPSAVLTPVMEPFAALGYSDTACADAEGLAEDLRFTARSLLGREPDLWHIHNHSLGKNSFTPRLATHLARSGCRLLLQPHDFAEDGRPENYRLLREHLNEELGRVLYPRAEHVWYAPINHRDKTFLASIGLPHVHVLPNTVNAHAAPPASAPAQQKTLVYPARAIRRKNLGEFLLWSLLAPEGYHFQSTLAPQNPKWQGYYKDWVAFARELKLPVEFDAGRTHDFSRLVQDAEALITTSIAEGFGLAFLEPWLEGKALTGRKLPEITADFEAGGLDLSALYDRLPVPLDWIGEDEFRKTLEGTMHRSYVAYAREWNLALSEHAFHSLVVDGRVDFGILNEAMQRQVIRHLAEHPEDRGLLPPFPAAPDAGMIEHNRMIVERQYGIEAYGSRLLQLYEDLAAVSPGKVESADAGALLDCFLRPERFNLLRA